MAKKINRIILILSLSIMAITLMKWYGMDKDQVLNKGKQWINTTTNSLSKEKKDELPSGHYLPVSKNQPTFPMHETKESLNANLLDIPAVEEAPDPEAGRYDNSGINKENEPSSVETNSGILVTSQDDETDLNSSSLKPDDIRKIVQLIRDRENTNE